MSMVKNRAAVLDKLSLWAKKPQQVAIAHFQQAVWAVFCKIVYATPQWSGKAVANWNIGLGAPDFSVDEQAGEGGGVKTFAAGSKFSPRQAGDPKWAEFAKDMNKYKIRKIGVNTKVFISNGVTGDTDHGHSSANYLADLQDPTYWAQKLRLVNMPYETVFEVLISESWKEMLGPRSNLRDTEGLLG